MTPTETLAQKIVNDLAPGLLNKKIAIQDVVNNVLQLFEDVKTSNEYMTNLLYDVFTSGDLRLIICSKAPAEWTQPGLVYVNVDAKDGILLYYGSDNLLVPVIRKVLEESLKLVPSFVKVTVSRYVEDAQRPIMHAKIGYGSKLPLADITIEAKYDELLNTGAISVTIDNCGSYMYKACRLEKKHFINRKYLTKVLNPDKTVSEKTVQLLMTLPILGTAERTELYLYKIGKLNIAELWIHHPDETKVIALSVQDIEKLTNVLEREIPNIRKRTINLWTRDIIRLELTKDKT